MHERSGVTIVEVLVVIGILGLLVAVSIPAVQQARESSRQVTCKNHLRQIGLAMANMAEAHGAFPTSQKPESAYWRMLPYLDAKQLYDVLMADQTPDTFRVPTWICPDDAVANVNVEWGEVSYYFNEGTQFRRSTVNGFKKSNSIDTQPRDVSDGLSQTVALSERLVRPLVDPLPPEEAMKKESGRYFWWTNVRYRDRGQEVLAVEECRNQRTTVLPQFWGMNALNYYLSWGYDHLLPPNHPGCYNGPEDFSVDHEAHLIPASSNHPGGVHSLLGDGSVHFVSERIDADVWQALGTRNGQETLNSPFGS